MLLNRDIIPDQNFYWIFLPSIWFLENSTDFDRSREIITRVFSDRKNRFHYTNKSVCNRQPSRYLYFLRRYTKFIYLT